MYSIKSHRAQWIKSFEDLKRNGREFQIVSTKINQYDISVEIAYKYCEHTQWMNIDVSETPTDLFIKSCIVFVVRIKNEIRDRDEAIRKLNRENDSGLATIGLLKSYIDHQF